MIAWMCSCNFKVHNGVIYHELGCPYRDAPRRVTAVYRATNGSACDNCARLQLELFSAQSECQRLERRLWALERRGRRRP
jgi:hypothetical protein